MRTTVHARYLRDLPRSLTELRCRLLFMELGAGRLVLDAVVSSSSAGRPVASGVAEPGSVITVVTEVPNTGWGMAARATLERWVGEGREVNLRLRRRRARRTQVEAASDEASMLLDLVG